jgi:lysophospholipase L1-like esterase
MAKRLLVVGLLLGAVLIFAIWFLTRENSTQPMQSPPQTQNNPADPSGKIRYVAVGDSYTIGLGVRADERWPNVMARNLNNAGVNIELVLNPSVSGYEVQDAIEIELPKVEKIRPDFVTVFIGANDNFRSKDADIYNKDLTELLDKLQPMLTNPKNIVLITIPDYTKSPAGRGYDTGSQSRLIEEYNQVIKDEANKRGLKVADIFPLSRSMTGSEDYIYDGLHPSGNGYLKWEKVIYPVVLELLKAQ